MEAFDLIKMGDVKAAQDLLNERLPAVEESRTKMIAKMEELDRLKGREPGYIPGQAEIQSFEFKEDRLGILMEDVGNRVVIVGSVDGSPSKKAGVPDGSIIIDVNGAPVGGMNKEQVVGVITKATRPVTMRVAK